MDARPGGGETGEEGVAGAEGEGAELVPGVGERRARRKDSKEDLRVEIPVAAATGGRS